MALKFWTNRNVFAASVIFRVVLLLYGFLQDAYSTVKYTDIDYFVFTDAARYVAQGQSPYARETYRYTPLLAWMLLPTSWPGLGWFSSGKILFAAADVLAGYFLVLILRSPAGGRLSKERALKLASTWLLNPMVATISTRGSSEGLLDVLVIALLWSVLARRIKLAGVLLGVAVHLKIYPFIYAPSLFLYLESSAAPSRHSSSLAVQVRHFLNRSRLELTLTSFATFALLNAGMYVAYGAPFLEHTYFYHLIRTDHRHNFSPYNTLLYASSSSSSSLLSATADGASTAAVPRFRLESLAFLPQLALSAVLLPLVLAKRHLPSTMLAQTWAFVALNKVCTSQYFLWYLILLPLYLPHSTFMRRPAVGMVALVLWIAAQSVWLQQGYGLEFLGRSTFMPGLWLAALGFYAVNMWILSVIIGDVGAIGQDQDLAMEVKS